MHILYIYRFYSGLSGINNADKYFGIFFLKIVKLQCVIYSVSADIQC